MCELCQTFEKEQVTAEPREVPVLPQWNGRATDEQSNVGRYFIYTYHQVHLPVTVCQRPQCFWDFISMAGTTDSSIAGTADAASNISTTAKNSSHGQL